MPNQWQLTCEPEGPCYVIVNKSDVYFCVEQWDGGYPPGPDWGVGRLDRKVVGRTPRPIQQLGSPAPNLTMIHHPNRIPMKVESVQLQSSGSGYYVVGGHVLQNSSGSMVIDESTGEVVGSVHGPGAGGPHPIGEGCAPPPYESGCVREDFAVPGSVYLTAAYLAAAYVP